MQNDYGFLVKDIPQNDVEVFLKETKADVSVNKIVNKVSINYSWVDVINDALPYIDTIINNPRRFITQEEDVIKIEKTKRVSQESVKHLAVHTNYIQDIDEDGMVKPAKLLNVFREETIDLYENRFIYTLINNLYMFIREQLIYKEESVENKEEKSVVYNANTIFNNQDINISLNMSSRKINDDLLSNEEFEARNEKINNIKDIIEGFMSSKFMKTMKNATPVRSPIRKTNLILKEQNFRKARELWEWLEKFQIDNPVTTINQNDNLTNKQFIKDFGLTFFLNYGILTETINRNEQAKLPELANLEESVYDEAMKFSVDEDDLRMKLNKQINKAANYKKEQKVKAIHAYENAIKIHNARIRKTLLLFK